MPIALGKVATHNDVANLLSDDAKAPLKEIQQLKNQKQKGFSLIELLIVVAIILIIAAIAIPNLLKSRMAANESSAVGSLRTINTALVTYSSGCPNLGFAATLKEMNLGTACASGTGIIDNVLGQNPATKSGYVITYTAGAAGANGVISTYTTVGVPLTVGTTGQRGFFTDQSGVIRYNQTGLAPTVAALALQ
jgi:type IV pilus assembly protein PilA